MHSAAHAPLVSSQVIDSSLCECPIAHRHPSWVSGRLERASRSGKQRSGPRRGAPVPEAPAVCWGRCGRDLEGAIHAHHSRRLRNGLIESFSKGANSPLSLAGTRTLACCQPHRKGPLALQDGLSLLDVIGNVITRNIITVHSSTAESKMARANAFLLCGGLRKQFASGNPVFLDTALKAEGETIRVHGSVMATHGPFWRASVAGPMARCVGRLAMQERHHLAPWLVFQCGCLLVNMKRSDTSQSTTEHATFVCFPLHFQTG